MHQCILLFGPMIFTIVQETILNAKNNQDLVNRVRSQYYTTGDVSAAYIALQCIGFNHKLYEELISTQITHPNFGESNEGLKRKASAKDGEGQRGSSPQKLMLTVSDEEIRKPDDGHATEDNGSCNDE